MQLTQPIPLLTVRRLAQLTGLPVSAVRRVLDENPGIQPRAVADFRPVYDNQALELFRNTIASADGVSR